MIVRQPKRASKAVVCITKLVKTANGIDDERYGTGFLYRDKSDQIWLVSNWHVFAGRRPDAPGHLIGSASDSPYALSMGLPLKGEGRFIVKDYPLYANGEPLWKEHPQGRIFDIAALPIHPDPAFEVVCIQDAASAQMGAIEPGFDLITIGFPFRAGNDVPFPLWKRAMLSSEPSVQMFANPQMLIDTAGTPGMSGSPVFIPHEAYLESAGSREARIRVDRGETMFFDEPELYDFSREKKTVELEWVGIYAGATENRALEKLQLGRVYASSAVDEVIVAGAAGYNPFPPSI